MGETQIIDGLDPEYKKRFMHHYNFPQYSVGETGRYGAPGRREIGHGALGERALAQVLPSLEEFPYAIRLVAEVLESMVLHLRLLSVRELLPLWLVGCQSRRQ